MAERGALHGLRVLVTRPHHQAETLARLIENEGGEAVRFPALEIAEPADRARLDRLLDRLDEFDVAIFVSPNAVDRALPLMRARRATLPAHLRIAAVGEGTARALREAGIGPVLAPRERFDSESLAALAELQQLEAKRVVIFRGQGGREHLAEQLRRRGAKVEYAECYRRTRPSTSPAALQERLARGGLDIVTLTSAEALHNLEAMLGQAAGAALKRLPVVVVSARLAEACRESGFAHAPIVAATAADGAIVAAIKEWRATQNSL